MRAIIRGTVHGFRCARGTLVIAAAILTLAMTAAIVTYSVVDAVVLRSLPYAAPSRLIAIATPATAPGALGGLSPADFFQLERTARSFSDIAASRPAAPIYLEGSDGRNAIAARLVTTNLFELLGVRAVAGRMFSREDERVGGLTPAILTYDAWVARFGSDPNIVGRTINSAQEEIQIVGVLPAGVWYPMELPPPTIYFPYRATEADRANNRIRPMSVVARLQPRITIAQSRDDIVRASASPVVVLPLLDRVVGPAKRWSYLVLVAVLLVLLIACVNVATLLLARSATRAREFAVRASLGESRGSLTATLLLEGLFVATAAGTAAIVVSALGLETAKATLPAGLTRTASIAINGRVVLVALGMVVCAAGIFGSAPAWLMRFTDLMGLMKSAGGPVASGRQIDRAIAKFLVVEIAVVSVLLVATTLIVRSFILITTADLGFDRQNVASIEYRRPAVGSDSERRVAAATLRKQLLERVRAIPGIAGAAISVNAPVPLAGASVRYSVEIPGYGETLNEDLLETRFVTPQYFDVMRMQLSSGRCFSDEDRLGTPAVVVINDVAAQRFFRNHDPIGETIRFRAPTTVIGVVRSVRHEGPEGNLRPEMYLPADQDTSRLPMDIGSIVFRTTDHDRRVAETVRDSMRGILGVDPDAPQFVDDHFRRITAGRRFNATLMAGFGLVAIVLGLAGVYASMQFAVRRQYRDIGVRLALGAAPLHVIREIVGAAFHRITFGLLVGLALTVGISSVFRSFVFGIQTTEPSVYLGVAALAIVLGLIAAILPALHASRIDPAETLRRD